MIICNVNGTKVQARTGKALLLALVRLLAGLMPLWLFIIGTAVGQAITEAM